MTGLEAEKAKMLGAANTYPDPAASGSAGVGFLGHTGDGIECQSPQLTGQQLKIRYAALVAATLTLEVGGKKQKISFPATCAWAGNYAYSYLTVDAPIPEKAIVRLVREADDGAVNLDVLRGIAKQSDAD